MCVCVGGQRASDGVALITVPSCGFLEPSGGCKDPHSQETLMPSGTNGQAESPVHQHQGSWIWASNAVANIVGGSYFYRLKQINELTRLEVGELPDTQDEC